MVRARHVPSVSYRPMTLDPLRLAAQLHGHFGWLAVAALVHPAVLLRSRTRRADIAVAAATALVTATSAVGAWLYGPYRERLRQGIFITSRPVGLLFERKEHLAFGALVLAWAAASAYFAAPRATEALRDPLRTIAFRAYCGAAALAIVVATLGTIVAAYRSF